MAAPYFADRPAQPGLADDLGTSECLFSFIPDTNGLYKAECVYGPDTAGWDDFEHLELATLSWVSWFNQTRLHGHCGDVRPPQNSRRRSTLHSRPTTP